MLKKRVGEKKKKENIVSKVKGRVKIDCLNGKKLM